MSHDKPNRYNIPESWIEAKVGDVCSQPQYGYTTSAATSGEIKLLRTTDITSGKIDWGTVPFCLSSPNDINKYLLSDGDIVISRAGSVGVSYLIKRPEKAVFASYLIRFRPFEQVALKEYFHLFLQSPFYWDEITEKSLGIAIPNVNASKIREIVIPLSPIPEQHRIVAKTEELFSELDKGVETLKTVQQQLKVYRQAVLKWAFEGKLTNSQLTEGVSPKGWRSVKIEEVAETFGGYAFKSDHFKKEGKYQVLRMGNVRPGILRYDESPVFLEEVDEAVLRRSLLKPNDVIITQTGTRKKRDYGFTALISKPNLLLNQRIAALRFSETYSPKFFLYFSWTDLFKDQFFANETGNVGQGNVGMKAVTGSLIPLCPLEEQNQIVQEIESRLSMADKIEESISQSLKQAEALRQSILKKAFSGKLVPQDPNDEPAEKLLARIRAEKAAQTLVKGTVKGKGRGKKASPPPTAAAGTP